MPGRTDALVNGCPVCNATLPCLYDIIADPLERNNVAAANPGVVARLAAALAGYTPYVTGHLPQSVLDANYTALDKSHFGNFAGPCFYRKGTPAPPPGPRPAPGPPPPSPPPPPAPQCRACGKDQQDVHYPGNDLPGRGKAASSAACCTLCGGAAGCVGFSWSAAMQACSLKSKMHGTGTSSRGFVSGRCAAP